ncbi:MAG: PEGA domain-containing protein [Alistipes sp.]|nr:PEGA domain-containing protein [Alistipes sp.]MBQ5836922.1 PEGA domain-containing protein [Alistipes sp.]
MRIIKYLTVLLLCTIVPQLSVAQSAKSLEIDAASFAPVQSGVLEGVAIDKIPTDNSKRPCARIKLHINRMSREDIATLEVRTIGGNIEIMRKVVAGEGNGLIIELTAKENTRFYLHHDKYGDSNEVSLNLEGNKEYKLEAQLCQMQSIIVSSNVIGADIYVDDVFKGKTDDSFTLTVSDVMFGLHKLRAEYGVERSEMQIEVSTTKISFKIDVNNPLQRGQYVVFEVTPQDATIVIDGKAYIPDNEGVWNGLMSNGVHKYTVAAKDHHTESGEFIINGQKVVKNIKLKPKYGWIEVSGEGALNEARVYIDGDLIGTTPIRSDKLASGTHKVKIVKNLYKIHLGEVEVKDNEIALYAPKLVADFAYVTITSGSGSEIYVNGEKKGVTTWSGNLATGNYIFEARKAGHRPTSISESISAEQPKRKFTLPTPTPILGTLNITSSPAKASIYIDGRAVGETPYMVDILVGKHRVSIRKKGYADKWQEVVVKEGATENLHASLTPSLESSEKTKPAFQSPTTAASTRAVKVKYYSDASVYVDGQYRGLARGLIYLTPQRNYYIVVNSGGTMRGKHIWVSSSTSEQEVDMYNAPIVRSINAPTTNNPTQSLSTSTTANKKRRSGWNSFNLGLSIGGGYDIVSDDYELNAGILFRMWNHETLFNAMTGVNYMRMSGFHLVAVPALVNWNMVRAGGFTWYLGLGTEASFLFNNYDGTSNDVWVDFPVVVQTGFSTRHSDISCYFKYYTGYDFCPIGIRYSYLF